MNNSVLRALQALTNRINLSTGLTHPTDRNSALEMLVFLRTNGIALNADEIYLWAINNGWQTNFATDLTNTIDQLNAGHNFRIIGGPYWQQSFLDSLLTN